MNRLLIRLSILSYEELEDWYFKIVNLEEVQELLYDFDFSIRIANDTNNQAFGVCSSDKEIGINIIKHDNLAELINTIAHELAHGKIFAHCREHDRLTKILENRILELISVNSTSYRNYPKKLNQPVSNNRTVTPRRNTGYTLDEIHAKLSKGGFEKNDYK